MSDREQRDGGRSAENNKNNRGGNGRRNDRRNQQDNERDKYIERVVTINRVSKTVKGGRNMSFTLSSSLVTARVRLALATARPRKSRPQSRRVLKRLARTSSAFR